MGRHVQHVYVSSTYKDLVGVRRRVIAAIGKLQQTHHAINMENYTADSRPALDKCLSDVRDSDIYVGLIGWRGGHVPAGETLPITQLEYQAALDKRLPCLFFLIGETPPPEPNDPKQRADRQRALDFRERVQERHTCKPVREQDAIGEDVMAALFSQAVCQPGARPRTDPVSQRMPWLPYACDRAPQQSEMRLRLTDRTAGVPICIVHGSDEQLPFRLVDWLRERLFCELLLVPKQQPIEERALKWPMGNLSDGEFRRALELELAGAARCDALDERSLKLALAGMPPHYFSVELPLDGFERRAFGARLHAFVAVMQEWLARADTRGVVLWMTYRAARKRFLGLSLRGRSIADDVEPVLQQVAEQHKTTVRLTTRLGNVPKSEALDWARSAEVKKAVHPRRLEEGIDRVYDDGGQDALPLKPLGEQLKALLDGEKMERGT